MLRLLMGFLVRLIEHIIDVDIFNGFNGGIKPTLRIESRHRVITFQPCSSGVGGSVEGHIESILAECNSIRESVFDSGPCFLNEALEFIEVRWMFFDDNLFHYLLVREDDGRGE